MALEFVAGGLTLANWGFSAGDVAALAGAGRHIGTWLNNHLNDRTLFDWLGADVDTLFTRRGLLDIEELQRRWDRKIVLLQNGKRKTFNTAPSGTSLNRMDRWTWLMTLYTATLDAAVSSTDMREIITKVLLKIFEDLEEDSEFVEREASKHIAGWRSASCVRGICARASDLWTDLGRRGKHPHGFIPSSEIPEVVRFLVWLMNGNGDKESKSFRTASTDIFSMAIILESIGVKLVTSDNASYQFDESDTTVLWDANMLYPMAFAKEQRNCRTGMRIPLANIEEVGSLHPADRNEMREIMLEVFEAVNADRLQLKPGFSPNNPPYVKGSPFLEDEQDLIYTLTQRSNDTAVRVSGDSKRIADWFLIQQTPAICKALLSIVQRLGRSKDEMHNLEVLAFSLDNQEQSNDRFHGLRADHNYGDALNYIQAFVLGYWYALLSPLVDSSQLPMKEGFGAWGWADMECLNFIRQCNASKIYNRLNSGGKLFSMYRLDVLKLVGYLFGGTDISQAQSMKFGALGVLGKLPVLYTSLLGGNVKSIGRFPLLDVDATCIPSSISGIVLPGRPKPIARNEGQFGETLGLDEFDLRSLARHSKVDFTTHIEPDWDYDAQTCLVAYRYQGRIIHRLNPRLIDVVLARELNRTETGQEDTTSSDDEAEQNPSYQLNKVYRAIPLDGFYGSVTVHPSVFMADNDAAPPGYTFDPLLLNTIGLANAFICLLCMYRGWQSNNHARLRVVRGQKEFNDAITAFQKVLLLCEETQPEN